MGQCSLLWSASKQWVEAGITCTDVLPVFPGPPAIFLLAAPPPPWMLVWFLVLARGTKANMSRCCLLQVAGRAGERTLQSIGSIRGSVLDHPQSSRIL